MRDPRLIRLADALAGAPIHDQPREPGMIEAAVTLLLRPATALELLLIRRVERTGDPWSGHVALPGGRRSTSDGDLLATALRETREEVGVAVDRGHDVVGALDEVVPRSRSLPLLVVAPFVAAAPAHVEVRLDPAEVESTVWVPLPALRDPAAVDEVLIELEQGFRVFPAIRYREYRIWGLTHRILMQFLEVAASI
jgi:8-oxo-dGTP pyrophosphatase MutT (NUDIX family)